MAEGNSTGATADSISRKIIGLEQKRNDMVGALDQNKAIGPTDRQTLESKITSVSDEIRKLQEQFDKAPRE